MKTAVLSNIFLYSLFFVLSAIFLYFFSYGTSSLYPNYGGDSEIFILVGKAISEGKILYKDIFDHKGPILFFINALGYKVGGIKGIFFLQIINLTIIQILVYKISRLYFKSKFLSLIPVWSIFFVFASSIDDGNVSEEYSIPFVLLSLYFYLKYLLSNKIKHPLQYSFIYGVCLSVISLIRFNNGVVIGSIIIVLFVFLLINRQYLDLVKNCLCFCLGFFLLFFLVSIYFIKNKILNEFIYATFIFNIKYSGVYPRAPFLSYSELLISGFVLLPILLLYATLYIYRKNLSSSFVYLSLLIGIFSFASIRMGGGLLHYQMLNLFPFILAVMLCVLIIRDTKIEKRIKYIVFLLLIIVSLSLLYQSRRIIWVYNLSRNKTELYNTFRAVLFDKEMVDKLIPIEDRNSVYGYNVRSYWFLETGILPAYKYFTNQELWIRVDKEEVYEGINNYLLNTPPKWIILPKQHLISWMMGVEGNPILLNQLNSKYKKVAEDIDYMYYMYQ